MTEKLEVIAAPSVRCERLAGFDAVVQTFKDGHTEILCSAYGHVGGDRIGCRYGVPDNNSCIYKRYRQV